MISPMASNTFITMTTESKILATSMHICIYMHILACRTFHVKRKTFEQKVVMVFGKLSDSGQSQATIFPKPSHMFIFTDDIQMIECIFAYIRTKI